MGDKLWVVMGPVCGRLVHVRVWVVIGQLCVVDWSM